MATSGVSTNTILIHNDTGRRPTDRDSEEEVPESMVFADDVVMCGANEVGMTEYLESRKNRWKSRNESQ